jgi:multidrug transporter EmrE-like cation transporter
MASRKEIKSCRRCQSPKAARWIVSPLTPTASGICLTRSHQRASIATISVLYSVSLVLLLTGVGVVLFGESLNYYELAGIVLAVASLVLLMRFA